MTSRLSDAIGDALHNVNNALAPLMAEDADPRTHHLTTGERRSCHLRIADAMKVLKAAREAEP